MEYTHIQWIAENYGEELMLAVEREGIMLEPHQVLELFVNADPSTRKGAVDWMVKAYIDGGFLLEDLYGGLQSKVCETVSWFAQHRKKLEGESKNLSSYQTLAEVYGAIKPFLQPENLNQAEISGKALKRKEKEEVFAESHLLRREDNLLIAVPLTKRASQWWGKGTRWCTAATKGDSQIFGNMFEDYNQDAPLVIIVFPKGLSEPSQGESQDWEEEAGVRKFQLWVPEHTRSHQRIQFMDEADTAVSPEFIQQNWRAFQPVMEWAFQQNLYAVKYFPSHAITKKMAVTLLKDKNRLSFEGMIPENVIDQEIVDLLLSRKNCPLSMVSARFLTPELCKRAFEANKANASSIPHRFQTKEMCEQALDYSVALVQYLDPNLLDENMLHRGLKEHSANKHLDILTMFYLNIPPGLKTQSILERLSVLSPTIIQSFKATEITEEMVIRAIEHDALTKPDFASIRNTRSLINVPEHLWNHKTIGLLLEKTPDHIKVLPQRFINKSRFIQALDNPKFTLMELTWAPPGLVDTEVMEIILNKPTLLVRNVLSALSEETWTEEMAVRVLEKKPQLRGFVPRKFKNDSNDLDIKANDSVNKGVYFTEIDPGLVRGKSILNNIQSFGRVFRRPQGEALPPMLFIGDVHTVNEDRNQELLNAAGILNYEKEKQLGKKWNESTLEGLRAPEESKSLKLR